MSTSAHHDKMLQTSSLKNCLFSPNHGYLLMVQGQHLGMLELVHVTSLPLALTSASSWEAGLVLDWCLVPGPIIFLSPDSGEEIPRPNSLALPVGKTLCLWQTSDFC